MEESKKHIFYGDVVCNGSFSCDSFNGADLKYRLDQLSRIKNKYFVKEAIEQKIEIEILESTVSYTDFVINETKLNKDTEYTLVVRCTKDTCSLYIESNNDIYIGGGNADWPDEEENTIELDSKIIKNAIVDWNKATKVLSIPNIFIANKNSDKLKTQYYLYIPYAYKITGSGNILYYDNNVPRGVPDFTHIEGTTSQYEARYTFKSSELSDFGYFIFTFDIEIDLSNYNNNNVITTTLEENSENAKKIIPLIKEVK